MSKRYFMYKKRFIIPAVILLLALVARIILPGYLLYRTNIFLASFSPVYSLHLEDFDIDLFRGAYRFEGITGELKENNKQFVKINYVDVSIAWRELLNRRILTDIQVSELDFLIFKDIAKLSPPKKESKDIKETLFPVKVDRLELVNSAFTFEEYSSLKDESRLRLTKVNGVINNLTPGEYFPHSQFTMKANVLESSPILVDGTLNMLKSPLSWDIDSEMHDFDLTQLNPFLERNIPLTFTKGKLDLFVEAKSADGITQGYLKPFFKDLSVIGKMEEFKGVKHFSVEVLTAMGNSILKNPKTKTVATILSFDYNGKLNLKTGQSLSKALEHGFSKQLSPGIEQKYHLD